MPFALFLFLFFHFASLLSSGNLDKHQDLTKMAVGTLVEPIADPRLPSVATTEKGEVVGEITERAWGLRARVDPTVTFEEYQ